MGVRYRPSAPYVGPVTPKPNKVVEFRIGDAFSADAPLARWMTALAISHNDIRHCNLRLISAGRPVHESIYYFRLVASHFKEIAKDLDRASREWDEVRAFVDDLPEPARADFEAVLECASEMEAELGVLRNTLFHYPRLDRKNAAKDREKLQQAMKEAADLPGTITVGEYFGTVRFDFADEIIVQFIGEDDVAGPLMDKLQRGVLALWRFCHHAFEAYLATLPSTAYTVSLAEDVE
ncbi:MAG: hypothetical protein JWO74_2783 [Solirubrobacterales bacterium]|jgi:hypothetical protein|nr:hypothetical protein [Solirubrobacterales bacterium]